MSPMGRLLVATLATAGLLPGSVASADTVLADTGAAAVRPAQSLQLPVPRDSTRTVQPEVLRRRVEVLVRSGRTDEAIEMLEARREGEGLDRSLERRLARLYRDTERWSELEELTLAGLAEGQGEDDLDIGQLRLLSEARFELGRPDEARATLERILVRDEDDASLARLVANVLAQRGRPAEAIEVLSDTRARLGLPQEFAQMMGRLHAELGDVAAATREYCRVVVSSPLNVSLMRGQVLELAEDAPERLAAMQEAAEGVAEAHPEVPHVEIVVAELMLRRGQDDGAWRRLAPLLAEPRLEQELLRLALAGLADSRLPDADPESTLRRLRLSARISRGLLANETLPSALESRVSDTLIRSLLAMMENEAFARLSTDEQAAILDETLRSILDLQERFAGSELTSAALLRLAGVYVDGLHRPDSAIELYERLSMSPNATREHVKLARLGLARSYVAAGDTATAREVFHAIGQDMEFVQGQGRAQYHLGMIDFMGGHFSTASDRFKAVAKEQPRADYTNDALDLALVLAEHEFTGEQDDSALRAYGHALYLKATHEPEALLSTLESISTGPPHPLRERVRLDLAGLLRSDGRVEEAAGWARQVAAEVPQSRYAPKALDLEGELLEEMGRPGAALEVYERLLLEYEGYVMIDRVRDRIRALREDVATTEEGELP